MGKAWVSLGRPKAALKLTAGGAGGGLPHPEILLMCWWHESKCYYDPSKGAVSKWRQPFVEDRCRGLYGELHPGRTRSISNGKVATLLARTLKNKPPAGTHWGVRQAAEVDRLSKSTVHRVFQIFALQPHRSKLSTGPSLWRRCATS